MFPCMLEAFQSNGSFPHGRNPAETQALRHTESFLVNSLV